MANVKDMIKFQQGPLSALSTQAIANGTLWFTTDEGAIYLDTNGKRVRFGDYVIVDTVDDLPAAGHAYETALYYVKNDNILARWDTASSTWVQLNAAGLSQVVNGGANTNADTINAISKLEVVTNAKGAKVLTYKTNAVASNARVESAEAAIEGLQTAVNTINGGEGVSGSIDNKLAALKSEILGGGEDGEGQSLASVALAASNAQKAADAAQKTADDNTGLIEDIDARLEAAEGGLSTVTGLVGEGKVEDRINAAKNAVLGTDADAAGAATVAGANKAAAAAQSTANEAVEAAGENAEAIEGLEARVEANEGNISTLQGQVSTLNAGATTEGSVAYQIAQIVAGADQNYDTLKEIADWIVNDTAGVAALDNRIDKLEAADETHEAQIEALQGADTAIRGEFAAADTKLKNDLVNGANEGYRTLADIEAKVIEAKKAGTDAQATANAADTLSKSNAGRLDSAEAAIEGHGKTIGEHTTAISGLNTSLAELEAAYIAADTALETKLLGGASTDYNTLAKLEAKVKDNAGRLDTAEADIEAIENRLTWNVFGA